MPQDELPKLQHCLTPVPLLPHKILNAINEPVHDVYFVESGMVSLILLSQSGGGIETGMVGSDDMIGALVGLGTERSPVQAEVQVAGQAFMCPGSLFIDAYQSMPCLRELVNASIGRLLLQAQQNALCHALHSVESRLCRWMLQARDLLGSDVLDLKQSFLSSILGVQRSSVSITAHALQQLGFIRYRRGRIEILNRQGLEECTCQCYRTLSGKLLATSCEPVRAACNQTPLHRWTIDERHHRIDVDAGSTASSVAIVTR